MSASDNARQYGAGHDVALCGCQPVGAFGGQRRLMIRNRG
jgi:hypothetical protein